MTLSLLNKSVSRWSWLPLKFPFCSVPFKVSFVCQQQCERSIPFPLRSRVPKHSVLVIIKNNPSILLGSQSVRSMSLASSICLPNNVGWHEMRWYVNNEVSVFSKGCEVVLVGWNDGSSDSWIVGVVRRLVVECILSKSNLLSYCIHSYCSCSAFCAFEALLTNPLNIREWDITL